MSDKNQYEVTRNTLRRYIEDYNLTASEAIDYIAVEKTRTKNGTWSTVRDVEPGTISGNVSSARRKINNARLDGRVSEEDDRIRVFVEGRDGEAHTLPFLREQTVVGYDETARLEGVYECHSAIHGYYETESGEEFESTLLYDGEPYNSFEDFDRLDEWESWRQKADVVLWD